MENQKDPTGPSHGANECDRFAERLLLAQLQCHDAEAGRRFVRDYYPGVYRYLLSLTGRREVAEDLAQETFLRAWASLATFEGRAPLRAWLHRIAHREFLQFLRSRRPVVWLEEIEERADPEAGDLTGIVDLRVILSKLPLELREVVALHYLEGYTGDEIAEIVDAPVTTVHYRLLEARARLRRELGEGDLPYLNRPPGAVLLQWEWLPLEALTALEAHLCLVERRELRVESADKSEPAAPDRSTLNPQPSTDEKGEQSMSEPTRAGMSRRKLLEAAGTAAAAAAAAGLTGAVEAATRQNDAEITDDRLTRKISLAVKATALADLCEQLKAETTVSMMAGPSVADEKVTLFCEKRPLREVMRQLSRPFGYTWLRSGTPGHYRYELVQDLRSQLLEEELRNRDRNEALLALEREIEKYRPYLDLSPDEVLARAKTAPPEERRVLENLGGGRPGLGLAWGITQMYFRLMPQELAALRAGEELRFSQEPQSGEKVLPPDVARGVLQSLRTWRVLRTKDGYAGSAPEDPRGIPITAVPEARALVNLKLSQSELGQFALGGLVGYYGPKLYSRSDSGPCAVGVNPRTIQLENAVLNAKFAREPALQRSVSVQAQSDLTLLPPSLPGKGESPGAAAYHSGEEERPPSPSGGQERSDTSGGGGVGSEPKVTTADVLEALHHATGLPIIADFYTRLYPASAVSLKDQSLFVALNQLGDTMGLRWNEEETAGGAGAWLEFRSMTYYHDRLKEVPNRLLARWAMARREHSCLPLDELIEMTQLPDAQLGASNMAEGIRECWGLPEWDLARSWFVRDNLRFLAQLTPAQRQEAQSTNGLLFTRMSLAQQQAFFNRQLPGQPELHSLQELFGTALRVDYTQPGWFEWQPPEIPSLRWAVRSTPGRDGKWLPVPTVRERTRDTALQALRRLDPQIRDAVRATLQGLVDASAIPSVTDLPSEAAQIAPTELDLATIYIPGTAKDHVIFWRRGQQGVSDLD